MPRARDAAAALAVLVFVPALAAVAAGLPLRTLILSRLGFQVAESPQLLGSGPDAPAPDANNRPLSVASGLRPPSALKGLPVNTKESNDSISFVVAHQRLAAIVSSAAAEAPRAPIEATLVFQGHSDNVAAAVIENHGFELYAPLTDLAERFSRLVVAPSTLSRTEGEFSASLVAFDDFSEFDGEHELILRARLAAAAYGIMPFGVVVGTQAPIVDRLARSSASDFSGFSSGSGPRSAARLFPGEAPPPFVEETPVPEPGSAMLAGMALLTGFPLRRRRA